MSERGSEHLCCVGGLAVGGADGGCEALCGMGLAPAAAGSFAGLALGWRARRAQGGAGAGSALIRSSAATSAWAQGQERSSRSLTLRPERAIRPAWWSSR